ncbi:CdaR family transcriptional regulator [Leucobacter sp. BZR 635]
MTPTGTDTQMRELVAQAGRKLQAMAPQIVTDMTELLAERVSGLAQDAQLIEILHASIDGNVWTLGHVLTNDIGVDSMQPNTGAVEYAIRLAQRDVPLGSLTHAYYLGQAMCVRRGIDAVDQLGLEDKELQMNLVRLVTEVTHDYFDWILQYVTKVHVAEQARWWTARAVTNAAAVMKVLRGEAISVAGFESRTKYALERNHVAFIAWLELETNDTEDQQRVDQLLRRMASIVRSTRPPLITASDPSTAWAWATIPTDELDPETLARIEALASSEEARNIRVAVGTPGQGINGFRQSHEQAAKARVVALGTQRYREERLVAYGDPDVGVLSLIMHDPKGALTWTRNVLGPVAGCGEANAAMRETLAAYYASGGNISRTADELGLHRNTVRQRVGKFELDRGNRPQNSLEISLALRLCGLLGD